MNKEQFDNLSPATKIFAIVLSIGAGLSVLFWMIIFMIILLSFII